MCMYVYDYFSYKLHIEALLIKEDFQTTIDMLKPAIDAVILSARGNYSLLTVSSSSSSAYNNMMTTTYILVRVS